MAILRADGALKFDSQDYRQMAKVQDDIKQLLLREYAGNTEVALIIFALVRLAREFLYMYPGRMQTFLLQAVLPFLRSETKPEGAPKTPADRASQLLIH